VKRLKKQFDSSELILDLWMYRESLNSLLDAVNVVLMLLIFGWSNFDSIEKLLHFKSMRTGFSTGRTSALVRMSVVKTLLCQHPKRINYN